jgi:hypothetical protein
MNKKCLWVSDFKSSDHIGGAELTTDAIIEYAPQDILVNHVRTNELNNSYLKYDFLIFDSITRIPNYNFFGEMIEKKPFFSVEYDYNKITPHRHLFAKDELYLGYDNFWSDFYINFWKSEKRIGSFFMSENQSTIHKNILLDFIDIDFSKKSITLSSVFSKSSLSFLKKAASSKSKRSGHLIYDTSNPLKGRDKSINFAKSNNLEPIKLFKNISNKQLIHKMSKSKSLVFMPNMHDTCPRMVIEAYLAGCDLYINDYVQMKDEDWFQNRESALAYMQNRGNFFWENVKAKI